jgi:hypothetical protein
MAPRRVECVKYQIRLRLSQTTYCFNWIELGNSLTDYPYIFFNIKYINIQLIRISKNLFKKNKNIKE